MFPFKTKLNLEQICVAKSPGPKFHLNKKVYFSMSLSQCPIFSPISLGHYLSHSLFLSLTLFSVSDHGIMPK